ncbi:MAG TPA: RNA polymerase sigma factor [Saprospiraceae bacterium]|nr:RNA polymerase sigma factor [Saprospiraceae bacterium]HNG90707.1 RNA polymerase sigma factor [Saprospiraceae bacterium]
MSAILSDETLIQQALAGRQTAYGMLLRRYEQYAFTLAFRMLKNREDAHEVTQDSFLRAFRYLPEFRGEAKFSTWLYKIVRSTALNFLRKQNPDIRSIDDDERPITLPDEGAPDASHHLERRERQTTIQQAIRLLSPDDAQIITLFYLYEHSLEEICQIADLTMTNAKTKLCRARQRLKTIMETTYHAELN